MPEGARLRGGNGAVGVAHDAHDHLAALDHHFRLHPKERRFPDHQVGKLALLDAANIVGDAVRNGRVDGVFRNKALEAGVVAHLGIVATPRSVAARDWSDVPPRMVWLQELITTKTTLDLRDLLRRLDLLR